MPSPQSNGEVKLKVNGVDLPVADLHALYPSQDRIHLEELSVKIDNAIKVNQLQFRQLVQQYDRLIEDPHCSPEIKARALEAKARLVNVNAESATRIALTIERERRRALEKAKVQTDNKKLAVRLLEHNRMAAKVSKLTGFRNQIEAVGRPKVRMPIPGQKFRATIDPNLRWEDEP